MGKAASRINLLFCDSVHEFEYCLAEPVVFGVDAGDFGNVVVSARAGSGQILSR
jgi:hypothetical protein